MTYTVPPVAFAGVSERAIMLPTGTPNIWKHNFLGLRTVINAYLFPIALSDYYFVFGIYGLQNANFTEYTIRLLNPKGETVLDVTMGLNQNVSKEVGFEQKVLVGPFGSLTTEPVWSFFPIKLPVGLIREPGEYKVRLVIDNQEYPLGSLFFLYSQEPPLTADRVAALRSNPGMEMHVGYSFECPECNDRLFAYAGLDRLPEREKQGDIWYKDLSDEFVCKCGKVNISLHYVKENLHALLGKVRRSDEPVSMASLHERSERLYTKGILENICDQFTNLLDEKPAEEKVQQFIKKNPVLLQQFSAKRIFYKPPILTKYKTDIVILNQKNELLLIELEKPDITLLRQDAGISAELQHALDQVRDWLREIANRKEAVLDGIGGLKIDEVSSIKGVVICGRNKDYAPEHIHRLRSINFGGIEFFSYDDLTASLSFMAKRLETL